jgi:predicted nucleic acid-binding protein
MPAYVDTNILIHYLTRANGSKPARCLRLLERAEAGRNHLVLCDLAIAELVWVLESKTAYRRDRIRDLILPVLRIPGIRVSNRQLWERTFDVYCQHRVDFIDAYHVATMERTGDRRIYSYDRDFDRVEGIERLTP